MKVFIAVLVLIFSLQSWTKADDISDFEIEGMSVGDSLLDYFSLSDIKNNKKNFYNDNKFSISHLDNFKTFYFGKLYDAIQFSYKSNDKKYIIHGISALIDFSNSIKKCKQKKREIVKEIKSIFTNPDIKNDTISHPVDKTGKSKVYRTSFQINSSYKYFPIDVACFDFTKKTGMGDHLRLGIKTDEYNDWLHNKAYQ